MAAARPQMTEGSGGSGGGGDGDGGGNGGRGGAPGPGGPDGGNGGGPGGVPLGFRRAVATLTGARIRPQVRISELPPPKRLAPYAFALSATVPDPATRGHGLDEEVELADGRFVLLHDPAGQESWQGVFRVVTLARAELEPEMAGDPLLPEVSWSWLTGALESRGALHVAAGGTVTRAASTYYGGLGSRPPRTELEMRASWTPRPEPAARADAVPDLAPHLAAWAELLCQCAGLPPENGDGGSVVHLPQRRGPQPL